MSARKVVSSKRVLVVGGAGFIGSHLIDRLALERPRSLHVVDNLFLGRKENLTEARLLYPIIESLSKESTPDTADF